MARLLIVTGAGSGIGRAAVTSMGQLYDVVILIGRDLKKLDETKNAILEQKKHQKDDVIVCSCDLAKEEQILSMIKGLDGVLSKSSSISLINNAAIFRGEQNFENSNSKDWISYFNTNLMGVINLTRELLPYMKAKAIKPALSDYPTDCHCIVNIASTAGSKVVSGLSAYGSLKAALIYWSSTIALELGEKNIRVNVICPGIIDTPIHPFFSESKKDSKDYKAMAQAQVLNRIGHPQDVVEAIEYLCTTSWVTGSVLTVDGGISI